MIVPTLTTARLRLRALQITDAPFIADAVSDWEVIRWLTVPPYPYALSDAEWFVENASGAHWAICQGDSFCGLVSVKPDMGYWLGRKHHGHGIMTEAATAVINWYFQQADAPIASGYIVGNDASHHVLAKLGFVPTQVEMTRSAPLDKMVANQRMELTKSTWAQRIS